MVADAWHLRSLVRAALENKRTRVIETTSPRDLYAAAQTRRFDLIILDGDSVPQESAPSNSQSRPIPALAGVPVILLTDSPPPDDTTFPGPLQPDRTLHRHFSPFELLNAVYALTGY